VAEVVVVRWQQLFADLEAQFAEAATASERAEEASRARFEMGAVGLSDRLRGALGHPLVVRCRGAGQVNGTLADTGPDWLLLEDDGGRDVLVASRAVLAVGGLGRETATTEPSSVVRSRLDLRRAIRALARDRASVQVLLEDGATVSGTIDRVGADHVELAEHAADVARRSDAVVGVRAVVLDAIVLVRTLLPPLV
jgi:hypothetical protein